MTSENDFWGDYVGRRGERKERVFEELAKNVPRWIAAPGATAGVVSQVPARRGASGRGAIDLLLFEREEDRPLRATVLESKMKWERAARGQALFYWSDIVRSPSEYVASILAAVEKVRTKRLRRFPDALLGSDGEMTDALRRAGYGVLLGNGKRPAESTEHEFSPAELAREVENGLRSMKKNAKNEDRFRFLGSDDQYSAMLDEAAAAGSDEGDDTRYVRISTRVWRQMLAQGSMPEVRRPIHVLLGCATRETGTQPPEHVPSELLELLAPDLEAISNAPDSLQVGTGRVLGDLNGGRWAALLRAPAR